MTETTSTFDRVALVTGAAGGLGRGFAARLGALGYRVVLTDRAPCQEAVSRLEGQGVPAFGWPCDLGDRNEVQQLVHAVLARVRRVDVLVNNAAFMPQASLLGMEADLWRQVMAVNVDAPFLLAQAFLPGMRERGWGRIINLASSTVWGPPPGMGAYACSKMGVIGLTRALAAEFGRDGITVNAISPGLTRHEGSAAHLPAAAFEAVRQRQFIPRTEEPADLLGALEFLASDQSAFYTGQVMNVDGGGFGF